MTYRLLTCLGLLALVAFSEPKLALLGYRVDADWPQLPRGQNFGVAPSVTLDKQQNVYVFRRAEPPIWVFDKSGKFLRSLGEGIFANPHGLRIDPEGNIWGADNHSHIVVKMDPAGRIRMVLGRQGESGEAPDRFNGVTDVAFAPNGDLYVSDGYGNSRVVKFSKDGRFLLAWGKRGVGPGEFNLPHGIAVDKLGRVYVCDRENFRVQIFDPNGKFLNQWTHVGSPYGIDITDDDFVYLADGYNHRFLKLNLDGEILGVYGEYGELPGQFGRGPHHIAVAPDGVVYTGEVSNMRIQKFVPR